MSYQPLHQTAGVHVPHDDLLPDAGHGQLVARRENDVVGVVELLADVSHSVGELQCYAPASICQLFASICVKRIVHFFPNNNFERSQPLKVVLPTDALSRSSHQREVVSKSSKYKRVKVY